MADIPEKIIGHWCNIEQYRMLQRCSARQDMTEWNEWRRANPNEEVRLQGAKFTGFFMKEANFDSAYCEGAYFYNTVLEDACFNFSNIEYAKFTFCSLFKSGFKWSECDYSVFFSCNLRFINLHNASCSFVEFYVSDCRDSVFRGTRCETAAFKKSMLQGADFSTAWLSHETRMFKCAVDERTNFSNTSLVSVNVEPGIRAFLERNIRRLSWIEWYGDTWQRKLTTSPVRLFWWLSDYGYSTRRVLGVFALLIVTFAGLYTLFPEWLMIGSKPLPTDRVDWLFHFSRLFGGAGFDLEVANFWQMLSFAASTMVTLGFSNINVAVSPEGEPSGWGMAVVSLNLMAGYFMLAILVTRLAILFQTLGPVTKPSRMGAGVDKQRNPDRR
ncbi:pentapeptide repeat-containing protein [Phaeovibrio sulfidiphilus]|uniref:Pentapeptide repeat-containing protein n=1 Tax=Phaeovibrio sulfidiphilus TaxID=1220600 RepID=A0A8J7CPU3_9PROT|nr:pentapeptide repeat-containing protein [Phaeovibrio sulfidiphilus]MBE1237457.1 pentapeptide repeat-containing protein [Phaeovibrio sulfidiphilus]